MEKTDFYFCNNKQLKKQSSMSECNAINYIRNKKNPQKISFVQLENHSSNVPVEIRKC